MRFDPNDGAGTEPVARGVGGLIGDHPEPVPTYTGQITPPIHAPDTNPGTRTAPQLFGLSEQSSGGGSSSGSGSDSGSGSGGDQSTINRLIDLAAAEFGGGHSIMDSGGGVVALPTTVDSGGGSSGLSGKAVVFLLVALAGLGYYFYKKHNKKEAA